jgi:hypothetical protein
MPGGERGRVNLALTLKQGGNLLLLDEPANDLDVETLAPLEDALLEFPGCAVITIHDRWFLDRVAPHPGLGGRGELVLVRGQLRVLREEQDRPARPRGGPPAPDHLPEAHPLTRGTGHARRRSTRGHLGGHLDPRPRRVRHTRNLPAEPPGGTVKPRPEWGAVHPARPGDGLPLGTASTRPATMWP